VDISFDRVYRDLAPIDSIVQAAGRCNRSFERDSGRVTVWWLDAPNEQTKTPAEAVYNRGTALLPVAADTLDSIRVADGTLSEMDVARDAVNEYYRRLDEEKNVGKQTYADYVDAARADQLAELSLIDQRRAADVLVCRTKAERDLAEQLREAHRTHEFEALSKLLHKTKPFRISIPYYREDSETADAIRSLPTLLDDEGIYQLDVRQYDAYFDDTTGFVVPEDTVSHLFL
jgi:CRISPR/Cas system-associated endonuclease/helicase Cas3